MNRLTILSTAFALTTLLSACGDVAMSIPTVGKEESTIPKLTATAEDQTHDVIFRGHGSSISTSEADSLTSFLRTVSGGNTQAVHLTLRGNTPNGPFTSVVRSAVAAGIDPSKIEVEPGPTAASTPPAPGTVLVEVTARLYKVEALDCPHLSHFMIGDQANQTSSNYGCATQTDLAAMVADPHDLVRGESGGKTDSTVAGAAVDRLHDDKVKKFFTIGGGTTGASSGSGGGS
jgi:pilus assembly protein CpaD